MRLPARITPHHPLRKLIAALLIAAAATALAMIAHVTPGVKVAFAGLDNTLYDAFYHFRKPQDRTASQIIIITADESSLKQLSKKGFGWPWDRNLWGDAVGFVEAQGARAVVFDLIFEEESDNDADFAAKLDAARLPVIMGAYVEADGKPRPLPPELMKRARLIGAVNVIDDKVVRDYKETVNGQPSVAARAVEALKQDVPQWAGASFRLHFFGPNEYRDAAGVHRTYRYVPAWAVFSAAFELRAARALEDPQKQAAAVATAMDNAARNGITPDLFKDKVVLIGATSVGTYDVKSSPISPIFPGVEVQATAIDDLLSGQYVEVIGFRSSVAIALLASLVAAIGVILPRRATLKTLLAGVAAAALVGLAIELFVADHIRWLPMASPLVALLLTTVGAFAWSYLTEDKQRRLVLKALSQYVSPDVAAEIERNPAALKLGGERREMTVMFTDIQGFTDLSESMDSEKLSEMLNFYLGEMSGLILANNGTLDKYIGDAIMSFWNAPIAQADHAAMACRAALAMREREAQIQPQLAAMGAAGMLTRIGVNSGPMVFGNMGSPQKFNYSVLGDSVNLGSRLEGANKFYGSRILISETTAQGVSGRFVMRKLDLLRVKGKLKPLAVYELLAEGAATDELRDRIARYEEAFAAYQACKWDAAESLLKDLQERFPHDAPAAALRKRVEKLRHDPPPADWDGVYVAKDK